MNFASDFDVFREWGRAVAHGRFEPPRERRYNVATVYKRAQGQGRIRAVHGLDELYARHRTAVVANTLLPVGAHRRNWKATLVSDGFIMLRHPELAVALELADFVGTRVQLDAG